MTACSADIGELSAALSAAQLEFGQIRKGATNPFFKSKYADLADVIAATQKHLAKHGLAIVQHPLTEDGKAGVETYLLHKSGQWTNSKLLLPVAKADAQGIGSAITYARRYAYQAVIGVAADDDDDGNAAVSKKNFNQSEPVRFEGVVKECKVTPTGSVFQIGTTKCAIPSDGRLELDSMLAQGKGKVAEVGVIESRGPKGKYWEIVELYRLGDWNAESPAPKADEEVLEVTARDVKKALDEPPVPF